MLLIRDQRPFKFRSILNTLLTLIGPKQSSQQISIQFTAAGLQIQSQLIDLNTLIGFKIRKQLFPSYICQASLSLSLPLGKFAKIVDFPSETDDSITISYQMPCEEIKIRIYSTKSSRKTNVSMQIAQPQLQMINENNQQIPNILNYINGLMKTDNQAYVTYFSFLIQSYEFGRICKQFVQVSEIVTIVFQAQMESNKKYMIFSAQTQNGVKTISLIQERTSEQITNSPFQSQGLMKAKFSTKSLFNISRAGLNLDNQVFENSIKVIMEKDRSISIIYQVKDQKGEIACTIGMLN